MLRIHSFIQYLNVFRFEVIVTLQGTSPTTAQCSRTRTSYISSEILWGHKFKNCLKFLKKENAYVVNQKNFNLTEEHSTHLCSAKRFVEVCSSLSPTPTPRNYQFKVNILYSAGHRRGTVVSVETADGSSRSEEKSIKSVVKDEKKLEENKPNQILERPSTLSLPSSYNQPKTFSSRNEVSVAKPEITTEMYSNSQENQWEYQNYSGTHLPDFWLKETASLPLINDYNQEQGLKTRKFGSDLQNRRMKSFHAHLGNSNGSKGLLSPHRIFEGEEFVFDHSASAGESNASLISNYQRSQEIEYETDLNTMLRSMESYLEQNSTDGLSRASSPFPKSWKKAPIQRIWLVWECVWCSCDWECSKCFYKRENFRRNCNKQKRNW